MYQLIQMLKPKPNKANELEAGLLEQPTRYMDKRNAVPDTNGMAMNRTLVATPYSFYAQFDPRQILSSGDWVASIHNWAPLVYQDRTGGVLPGLAASWTIEEEGKVVRFQLREGLKWSDGSIMDRGQVLKSLQSSRDGTTHSNLKHALESIEVGKTDNEILFRLKRPVPALLIMLSYPDWAITNTSSPYLSSGPYSISSPPPMHQTGSARQPTNAVRFARNSMFVRGLFPTSLEEFEFVVMRSCSELLQRADEIISFRSYVDAWSEECEQQMKARGFKIYQSALTWSSRAVFTQAGLSKVSRDQRLLLLGLISKSLASGSLDFVRGFGLRPPGTFGSLSANEFLAILQSANSTGKWSAPRLSIVGQSTWTGWNTFQWFLKELEKLGIPHELTILDPGQMAHAYESGTLHTKYDMLLDPLGVGDPDPDGSWQIAAKFALKGQVAASELSSAFFEPNAQLRAERYKAIESSLLKNGVHIPIGFTGQIIGVHKSFAHLHLSNLFHGIAVYDLVQADR